MELTEAFQTGRHEVRLELMNKAKDWAMLHGLSMRPEDGSEDRLEFMPFTLLPSNFPRSEYKTIFSIQVSVNKLYHRMAYDSEFLYEALKDVISTDEFVRRLFDIYQRAKSAQKLSLALIRSDYMLDRQSSSCKQVEVNTIAAGHGWIGTACARLHRYLLDEWGVDYSDRNLPANEPVEGLCKAIVRAWRMYDKPNAIVLFIVEDYERNIADQRYHEYRIRQLDPRIFVLRRTLSHVFRRGRLVSSNQKLIVEELEVALVYFRSGYSPEHYPTEDQWKARFMIEQSNAIKCPSMGYVLAGMKKVQQVLTWPGCMEGLIEPELCAPLRRVFADFYSLDFTEAGEAALEMAIANPSDFVLKSQREGGGNNLFGEALKSKLESIRRSNERHSWTLMAKIPAVVQSNYIIRPNNCEIGDPVDVTSEIGIFGVVLADSRGIYWSRVSGHMLRTKYANCNEGGVSSGFGACDSPYLM